MSRTIQPIQYYFLIWPFIPTVDPSKKDVSYWVSHVREVHYVAGNILNLKIVTPDMTSSSLTNIQVYFVVIFSKYHYELLVFDS